MHGLVERLLILAQGDVDAFLNVQEVDLNEVVRSAVENTLIGSNGKASIDVGLPVAAVMVSIESDLVTQALVILLDNAVKFTPPGGLVDVRLTTTSDEVAVAVRDTGIGISQADLPRVFDRFYRAEASRTQPGSGLGLAIAHQIAERHSGRLDATSVLGEGSMFTLILPLAVRFAPESTDQS